MSKKLFNEWMEWCCKLDAINSIVHDCRPENRFHFEQAQKKAYRRVVQAERKILNA